MADDTHKHATEEIRRELIAKARAAAEKSGSTSYTISESRNASRMGIATRSRSGDSDSVAKDLLFEEWLQRPVEVTRDVVAYVRNHGLEFISSRTKKPVTAGTMRSWVGNWKRGPENGAFYPHIAVGREAEIDTALAKLGKSMPASVAQYTSTLASDLETPSPERVETTISRIVRDTQLSNSVKSLHKNCCQICGETIKLADGTSYSEGHHLQPLGKPHDGPDVAENILCVCPNHHAACDFGAIQLTISWLRQIEGHNIGEKYIAYHNAILYRGRR